MSILTQHVIPPLRSLSITEAGYIAAMPLNRQRGSRQAFEESCVPPANEAYRSQAPLYSPGSQSGKSESPRDQREGHTGGPTYQVDANDHDNSMESEGCNSTKWEEELGDLSWIDEFLESEGILEQGRV